MLKSKVAIASKSTPSDHPERAIALLAAIVFPVFLGGGGGGSLGDVGTEQYSSAVAQAIEAQIVPPRSPALDEQRGLTLKRGAEVDRLA
jgi:hypothetical protein